MRLGAYDESGHICDYTNKNCLHYQEFGIEEIIPYISGDIALIRLDRPIQFGPKMKPICLPFGNNRIETPRRESTFTAAGWRTDGDGKGVQIFTFRPQFHLYILPFLNKIKPFAIMYQFAPQRMVLEEIIFEYNFTNDASFSAYTSVRHCKNWLDQNMKM